MRLLDYIRGLRKGKEAHRIEREAMDDPFLSDALEGFDRVKGDHAQRIEELRKRLATPTRSQRQLHLRNWSIAASLLIAVLGGSYLLWVKTPEFVPSNELSAIEESIHQDSASSLSQPIASREKSDSATQLQAILAPETDTKPQREDLALSKKKDISVTQDEVIASKEVNEAITEVPGLKIAQQESIAATNIMDAFTVAQPSSSPPQIMIRGTSRITDSKIHGMVTDKESGEPLIGANIQIEGTTQGTITNADGFFTIDAQGKKLKVNYIGYEAMELRADSTKNMLIAMVPDKKTLDEVVVVGYGSRKKTSVTGSVSTVNPAGSSSEPLDGWRSYRKYLKKSLRKPTEGARKDISGTVILSFRIDADGRPIDITITQNLCQEADAEALRLLQEGPLWKQSSSRTTIKIKF